MAFQAGFSRVEKPFLFCFLPIYQQLVIQQTGKVAETLRLCIVPIPKIPRPISAIVAGSGIALSVMLSEKLTGLAGSA